MTMFGSLGFQELIFIFLLALLIFGPKKLPELGRTLGKAMAEFRKATTDLKRTINAELIEQELREADPRKMVRDSLREAKASLENAVRLDDEKATASKAAAAAATLAATDVTAGTAAFSDHVEIATVLTSPAAADAAAAEPAAAPGAAAPGAATPEEAPPTTREAPATRPAFEPAGAVARGALPADDEEPGATEPNAPQPAAS